MLLRANWHKHVALITNPAHPPRCSPGFEKNHTTSLLGESDCFPTVVCSHAVRRVFDGTNCVEPVRCASGMLALNVDLCTTSNEFYCATGYNRTVGSSGFWSHGCSIVR